MDEGLDFDITRARFERLLKIPFEKRQEDELFELMRLTSSFKVFERFKMSKMHKEICRFLYIKTYERGEIVFKQGDDGDSYYYVLRGSVDLYMYDIDKKNGLIRLKFLANVIAGFGFGELALMYDCPRTASAIPSCTTDLIVIKKRYYTGLVKDLHERELLDLINFYYSITIFKKEPISNILKFCLRTERKTLNSYEPFIMFGDRMHEYCIVQNGTVKAFVKINLTESLLSLSSSISEDEFVEKLKKIQEKKNENGIYTDVLDIMLFKEKDMFGEYFVAKNCKVNVYFVPVLPTEIIILKDDDLKKINPQLQATICKYARPVFDPELAFRKFYQNLTWKKNKTQMLKKVVDRD